MSLAGRTILITGATRGIGKAIALRCARDGANVIIAAKTVESGPKTPGTIYDAAHAVEAAGGKALPVQVDVRDDAALADAVAKAVQHFGGLDGVINNAGAINLQRAEQLDAKRYDLMMAINVRAPFLLAKLALPHLRQAPRAHFLTLSPPIDMRPKWFSQHAGYTTSKFAMTMTALGLAAELHGSNVAACTLWPRTLIATKAVEWIGGDTMLNASRTPEIMADAAYALLDSDPASVTGRSFIDEALLRARGVIDFAKYDNVPGAELLVDLFVDEQTVSA